MTELDGYQIHMMDASPFMYIPKRRGYVIYVKNYVCKKDFFDIKEGMYVWAHDNPDGEGIIIDHPKWKDHPINYKIFHEYFDDNDLLPFYAISSMSKKDRDEYYKSRNEQKEYK